MFSGAILPKIDFLKMKSKKIWRALAEGKVFARYHFALDATKTKNNQGRVSGNEEVNEEKVLRGRSNQQKSQSLAVVALLVVCWGR